MSDSDSFSDLVLELAEEFIERCRCGERPLLAEYIAKHPQLAAEIREVFPAMAMVERIAIEDDSLERDPVTPAVPELSQIGDYRIIREVGRGGMGVVYEAEQVSLGRRVAVKVLPRTVFDNDRVRKRFARESRAAARLHHTNIVPVFGVGEQDGLQYYVMQFIQGLGLDQVLVELRRLQLTGHSSSGKAMPQQIHVSLQGAERPIADHAEVSADAVARSLICGRLGETLLLPSDENRPSRGHQPADVNTDDSFTSSSADESSPAIQDPERCGGLNDTVADVLAETARSGEIPLPGQSQASSGRASRMPYWRSVATIGAEVANALQHAHQQGIVHRDIKPANLLMDMRGNVWVTDFGLAKASDQQDLTHTGDILGTLRYMAPEQFEGTVDHRTDTYSLGLTLYELLALRPAFMEKERHKLMKQVTTETPTPLKTLDSGLPTDLTTIVQKAIDRDPAHRYQSAQEMADDLDRFLRDEPILARRISPVTRFVRWCKRNPMGAAVVALLVVGFIGSLAAAALLVKEQNKTADALVLAEQNATEAQKESQLATHSKKLAQSAAQIAQQQEQLARQQRDQTLRNLYMAHIRLAQQDWSAGNLSRMLETLDVHRPVADIPDVRGWEWYYLASLTRKAQHVHIPQLGRISKARWHPDGRLVAISGSEGGEIYEPISQQVVHRWPGHVHLEWSPDGSRLAIVSYGADKRDISILATSDWTELHTFQTDGFVRFPSWKSDGTALVWGHTHRRFAVWPLGDEDIELIDYPTPKPSDLTSSHSYSVTALATSPQSDFLAIGSQFPQCLFLWDSKARKIEQSHELLGGGYNSIDWRSGGQELVASGFEGRLYIFDIAAGSLKLKISGHHGHATDCSWSPDGTQIVSGGEDHVVRIWDSSSGRETHRFPGHRGIVTTVDWSTKDDWIVSGSDDGEVRFWQRQTKPDARLVSGRNTAAWSPDGRWLAVSEPLGELSRTYAILDSETGEIVRTLLSEQNKHNLFMFAWSPNGRLIAGCMQEGTVQVWESATGQLLRSLDAHGNEARCVDWSPDNRLFATCGMDRLIKVWETSSGSLLHTFNEHKAPLGSVRWSPDGRWLASVDWRRDVKIRATDTWEIAWEIDQEPTAFGAGAGGDYTVAWHPDSSRFAVLNSTGQVVVWQLPESGPLVCQWRADAHTSNIRTLAWSPDGRRIASGSEDRTVKVLDAETGSELLTLDGFESMLKSVSWSPDGRQLCTGDGFSVQIRDASAAYAASTGGGAE